MLSFIDPVFEAKKGIKPSQPKSHAAFNDRN